MRMVPAAYADRVVSARRPQITAIAGVPRAAVGVPILPDGESNLATSRGNRSRSRTVMKLAARRD